MLRSSLRSVSGRSSRHVCLSCLVRPGAPSLRQFHHISALRTDSGEIKEANLFDALTEPPTPLPHNGQIPEAKDASSNQESQPIYPPKPKKLTASVWAGMNNTQQKNYRKRHPFEFNNFKRSMLANRDISLAEAVNLEMGQGEAAQPALSEAEPALSEAAALEAEKIKALQQKVMAADMEAKRERKAKIKAQLLEKEGKESPEVKIPDGADTPVSEPEKSTFKLKSTSNVVAQILEASCKNDGSLYKPRPEEETGELLRLKKHVISKDCGYLSLDHSSLRLKAVQTPLAPVPRVAFGLDRVLFNPGVYQLRDPRSLVYNFDPYLDKIMPVSEFDFDTLKPYITSSQDVTACEMTKKHEKRYYGSSSSMTGVLSHFHYLLSAWRPVDTSKITQGFSDDKRSFTRLLRAPSAMFLRYNEEKDIYAIDSDKEYDHATILMNLGKSMEKQLTMPKHEFERYRRTDANKITAEEEANTPESYHYSTIGKFLMRAQLDAYDPRLPGTGMFDLKTRAVVSIRMEPVEHERGMGYEIRRLFGKWESYEREYFDMIRAAFLKYSLQVRVGRMDGIFVAYHNVERIFGFQYITLGEMDQALHGQSNTDLGDTEFQLSLGLWEKILDKATQKFPKKSLRFHFEARDGAQPLMYIIAQPVTDEQIDAIQTKNKSQIEAIQARLFNPDMYSESTEPIEDTAEESAEAEAEAESLLNAESEVESLHADTEPAAQPLSDILFPEEPGEKEESSNDSEPVEIGSFFDVPESDPNYKSKPKPKPVTVKNYENEYDENVLAMTLVVHNKVNGIPVERPGSFSSKRDKWTIDYELNELDVKQGNEILQSCKKRRNQVLGANANNSQNAFFMNLKKITERGRAWRKRMDALDRQRGVLVYKDCSETSK